MKKSDLGKHCLLLHKPGFLDDVIKTIVAFTFIGQNIYHRLQCFRLILGLNFHGIKKDMVRLPPAAYPSYWDNSSR